jgi:hypothetical protein
MGSEPQFSARIDARNGVASNRLSAELDMATAQIMQGHLAPFERDAVAAITPDRRELTFLDRSAQSGLVADRARATGEQPPAGPDGAAACAFRGFELTGTEVLLDDREAIRQLEGFARSNALRPAQAATRVVADA